MLDMYYQRSWQGTESRVTITRLGNGNEGVQPIWDDREYDQVPFNQHSTLRDELAAPQVADGNVPRPGKVPTAMQFSVASSNGRGAPSGRP